LRENTLLHIGHTFSGLGWKDVQNSPRPETQKLTAFMIVIVWRRGGSPVRDAVINKGRKKEIDNAQHYRSIVGMRQSCLEPATTEPVVTRKDDYGLPRL
jgi:hypothetical protein